MLTTCTACGTQFRVSTADLRAVHGLVRCSRCHSVFDAFETLREEFEAARPNPEPAVVESSLPETPLSAPEQELPVISAHTETPDIDAIDHEIQLRPQPTSAPTADLFSDLWGESPSPAATDTMRNVSTHTEDDAPVLIEDHIPKPPALARDQALYKHVELPPRQRRLPKSPRQPRPINFWGVGVAVMALLLGIQVVSAQRLILSRAPVIGPPLAALYSTLGNPVTAPATPATWLVSTINVTSNPDMPGALSITGTLANSAASAQPWPILRVELMDRYGDALQARDFTGRDYLPANQAAASLTAGTAARFRIDVVDPGPEAVGFQVQSCFDVAGVRECGNTTTN